MQNCNINMFGTFYLTFCFMRKCSLPDASILENKNNSIFFSPSLNNIRIVNMQLGCPTHNHVPKKFNILVAGK